jgi:hypothetical protein
MGSEQEEWARAARAGRRRQRPFIFGLLAGLVVTVAAYVVMAMIAQDRQDRANQGEVVYEYRGKNTLFEVLVLPVLLGGAAFLIVFRATGGKLAASYENALRNR